MPVVRCILLCVLTTVIAQVCYKDSCSTSIEVESNSKEWSHNRVLMLHQVNPPEGFNLRRDVTLRLIFAARKFHPRFVLALPPWHRLYHWKVSQRPLPWKLFFDMRSLSNYTTVVDLEDIIQPEKRLVVDTVYRLSHFEIPFEDGKFIDKWEIKNESYHCDRRINFWGFNITAENVVCVSFQGSATKLFELIDSNSDNRIVMFVNAEVALHDEYGTAEYWRARKSFKFSDALINIAENFIKNTLNCENTLCDNYLAVHWRRGDFARVRRAQVPSVEGTVKQIHQKCKELNIQVIFIATDATIEEFNELKDSLSNMNLHAKFYKPSDDVLSYFSEGGVAIIDQIICSRANYFIGTYESTFTYRIQEEREIIGLNSDTTFNRLCPDTGECENPSRWTIVF